MTFLRTGMPASMCANCPKTARVCRGWLTNSPFAPSGGSAARWPPHFHSVVTPVRLPDRRSRGSGRIRNLTFRFRQNRHQAGGIGRVIVQ